MRHGEGTRELRKLHGDLSRGKDVSPREPLDLLPHPREVREGQAPHGRDSGPLHGQDVHGGSFPLRREEDVGLGDGHRVQDQDRMAREMLDVLKERFR